MFRYFSFILLFINLTSFSQTIFYQNTLKGRVAVRAFGIYDSSSVYIPLKSGDTINRAFLIATNMINPLKVTSYFNGHKINWNYTNKATNLFTFDESVNLNPKGRIHAIDITKYINSSDTVFTLYTPIDNLFDTNINNPNPLYVAFTLYLEYRNNLNTKLASSIVLNDINSAEIINYEISNLTSINNNYPVGLSLSMGKLASNVGDGSFIYVNSDSLGLVHGTECCRPSGWGVIGQYEYYNNNLYGIGDDLEDNVMDSTDLLSNIQTNVSYGDTQINLISSYESPNVPHLDETSNPIWATFLTYSTKCDTLHSYTNISDTLICAGEPLELKVGGDSSYTYAWRYRGNIINTDSILTVNPEHNQLYSIMVSDTSGCSKTEIININVNQRPTLYYNKHDAICPDDNGYIVIDSIDGIAPPYLYNNENSAWQTAPVFASLSAGDYTIRAIDTNGCISTNIVTIKDSINTQANFIIPTSLAKAPTTINFENQSQNATEYQWYINGTLITSETDLSYLFEEEGAYQIVLLASKSNGLCTDSIAKTINLGSYKSLILPTIWRLDNNLVVISNAYTQLNVKLLNNIGQIVLSKKQPLINGQNTILQETSIASGIYFYQLEAIDQNGKIDYFAGKLVRM